LFHNYVKEGPGTEFLSVQTYVHRWIPLGGITSPCCMHHMILRYMYQDTDITDRADILLTMLLRYIQWYNNLDRNGRCAIVYTMSVSVVQHRWHEGLVVKEVFQFALLQLQS